jgi:hypothetical protein
MLPDLKSSIVVGNKGRVPKVNNEIPSPVKQPQEGMFEVNNIMLLVYSFFHSFMRVLPYSLQEKALMHASDEQDRVIMSWVCRKRGKSVI